ncbi:MAG: hypothetical protein ACI9DC_005416, partial [Gammaproteobacteria bacterium]
SGASAVRALLPLPRLAGVTCARCALLGANTPWKRVRFTRGLGTKATSRAMKSIGSNMTCVVPSRCTSVDTWPKANANFRPPSRLTGQQPCCPFDSGSFGYRALLLIRRLGAPGAISSADWCKGDSVRHGRVSMRSCRGKPSQAQVWRQIPAAKTEPMMLS